VGGGFIKGIDLFSLAAMDDGIFNWCWLMIISIYHQIRRHPKKNLIPVTKSPGDNAQLG
jgi:hypothetical protein